MRRTLRAMPLGLALLALSCAGLYVRNEPAPAYRAPLETATPQPLSVYDAAELAVRNALSLKAAREALGAREAALRLGLRDFLPRLRLTVGADDELSERGRDVASRSLGLALSQVIWDGGRRSAARALERAELSLARDSLEREERVLAESAVAAYRSSQAAQARLAIRRESLALAEAERELLAKERELGLAKEGDLVEADLSLASMGLAVTEAELAAELAEAELAEALGLERLPPLSETLPTARLTVDFNEATLLAVALERSHELATAKATLDRRRAEARLAALSWLPTLSLEACGRAYGDGFPLTEAEWNVSIALSLDSVPLSGSSAGGTGSDLAGTRRTTRSASVEPLARLELALAPTQAAAAAAIEEERYAMALSKAERDFRAAAMSYRSAARLLAIKDGALALGEERLRIASLGARLGKATRAERVEAELRLAELRVEVVDAVLAFIAAERRLESLLFIPPSSLSALAERL